jgi:glycogen debranching enzyme
LAETDTLAQQQYYIAARSSPADDRPRVLKYGKLFAVFDHYGDIGAGESSDKGVFFHGTRFLSKLVFQMWNARPLLLSSTVKADNSLFTADLSNADVSRDDHVEIHRGTLHVLRSRVLYDAVCFEKLDICNFGASPIKIPLTLEFAADFADIFEVRGMHREERGRQFPPRTRDGNILLSYKGMDGVLRETSIEFEPNATDVQQDADGIKLYFEKNLEPGEKTELLLRIRCAPSNQGRALHYDQALKAVKRELDRSEEMIPQISSPNSRFTDWMKRSSADVHMMIAGNPEEHYPYAGVPWFSTVFGRDGIVTALEMLWASPWIAKGVLQFLAETQATELNPEIEAEPGKILHEMRGGEMAALKEVPFGKYYGSVDSTPLFVMLAGAYLDRTADIGFMRHLWPHIHLALKWMDEYGDCDGDGFIEYAQHSRKGLVQQGWKDSNDSVFHADGTLAKAPIALCEVQGYAYAAKLAAARISHALGDHETSRRLHHEAQTLQVCFNETFWCNDLSVYALALDGDKQPCRVRTSNAGQCLYTGIAPPETAARLAREMLQPDFFNGWGVRTVADGEVRYNPLSYHNGSVWPHDNALIASGMARYGFREMAGQILLALLDVSATVDLRRLPELFCGLERRPGEGPTLYPVACSPQTWAAAASFLLVQACLGISVHDGEKKIILDQPYLPEGIPQLLIKDLRSGDASVDLQLERSQNSVSLRVLGQRGKVEIVMK